MSETRKRFVYLAGTDLDGWDCKRCDAKFTYNLDYFAPKPRRTFAAFVWHCLVRHARLPKLFIQQDQQRVLIHKMKTVEWLIKVTAVVNDGSGGQP